MHGSFDRLHGLDVALGGVVLLVFGALGAVNMRFVRSFPKALSVAVLVDVVRDARVDQTPYSGRRRGCV